MPRLFKRALVGGSASLAIATAAIASDPAADPPERLAPLTPAIVTYRWTFLVPQWSVDTRIAHARLYAPAWRARRFDYALPDWRTERRVIGRIAEVSCKYGDFWLPNACTTTWRDVHVDVPVPVMQHESIDVDVPEWSWREERTPIGVPRLAWKEETLLVSLPALAVAADGMRRSPAVSHRGGDE